MKKIEQERARILRRSGHSINEISKKLKVSKSSVSLWVRDIDLTQTQLNILSQRSYSANAVEKRRQSRLRNELNKRNAIIGEAQDTIQAISHADLKLIGTMLYWAEGGKTQRLVRFSNGDPEMIKIIMTFFRKVCIVPESKFRGYIHIHPHLDYRQAEKYWSQISNISLDQFFKTYRKPNKSSQNKKNSLPYGTFDVYVMDTKLFYEITGWAQGIFKSY